MKEEDKQRFGNVIFSAASVFSKEITKTHVAALWLALEDYDIEQVEAAIMRHIKTGKFFPVPAEIIELIPTQKSSKVAKGQLLIEGDRKYKVLN